MNTKFINTQRIFKDVNRAIEITQPALVNGKLCDMASLFSPSPSPVHAARGVSLGVSVKEFEGSSLGIECFVFSGGLYQVWHLGTLRA